MTITTKAAAAACWLALAGAAAAADDAQSLFDAQTYRPLVAEDKAYRLGDILTVIVQETASATTAADSRADRKAAVAVEVGSSKVGTHTAHASAATEADGGGRTQRSGRLTALLSVRVVEVAANGDLTIHGDQRIVVNGEEQTITLRGVVRPRDIGENNTVPSARIAQATIHYDGEGFIADKSRPGWVSRLLTLLGL